MPELSTIYDYMRAHARLLGERILEDYPALHQFDDPVSPRIEGLLRTPFPAQTIAIMGLVKRWHEARTGMVVAECGTGKTLISLGGIHVHSEGRPFTALAMVPPHLVEKWAREAFLTLPGVRVFFIDDLRNGGDASKCHGVNEVRIRQARIVRVGLRTSLSELRLRGDSPNPRKRWLSLCARPSLFIVGRERAKLGYFWRHAYRIPRSGPYLGCAVNCDTGNPVFVNESRLTVADFEKVKIAEAVESRGQKCCRPFHSPLWQADRDRIRRMAPIETGEPFHIQQAAQIRAFRAAWKEAGHARTPRVSVSRSIFALVEDRDFDYFGRRGADEDQLGYIDGPTRAIFGRTYAAEPDVLIEQLRKDEALTEADTLLLTIPNQLGVPYNVHALQAILTTVAPALGWR